MNNLRNIVAIICFCIISFNAVSQIVINELLTSNTTSNLDTKDYWEYNDWLEIWNQGSSTISLSGFSLTDDLSDPQQWVFPEGSEIEAGELLLIWVDGNNKSPDDWDTLFYNFEIPKLIRDYHTNFKFSSEGESIALIDSTGNIVDSLTFGKQLNDVSIGRKADNNNEWAYFGNPTPGVANNTISADEIVFAGEVQMSQSGGVYQSAQMISMQAAPEESIRYTTDGSIPKENSTLYSSPVSINNSTIIKARTFKENEIVGTLNTQSFIIAPNPSLPTISIASGQSDLWSLSYGIYQNGYKDREIPSTLEYFDKSGDKQFSIGVGAELFGSNIFYLDQKPFSFTTKDKYGTDLLQYPLFEERGEVYYKNFVIRNGGNDNGLSFFRDALVMSILKDKMDLDYQGFKPVSVYLNGDYWGLYNLREKLNEEYLGYTHDVNPNDVNVLESIGIPNQGNATSYEQLINFIENNSLAEESNYQYVVSQIDLNNYLDYKILKIFIGYWIDDVNLKYWQKEGEKWRWMAFDLEHSFARLSGDSCHVNTLEKVSSGYEFIPDWATLMFSKLLENDDFKNIFVQRFLTHLNTTFQSAEVIQIIDNLQEQYFSEMVRHINRWNSDPQAIQSLESWLMNIQELRDFANCRPAFVYDHLMQMMEESNTFSLQIEVPSQDTAILLVNGIQIPSGTYTGTYLANLPLEVISIAQPNFELNSWNGMVSSDTIQFDLTGDTLLIPEYTQTNISHLSDSIHQDLTLTQANSPYTISDDIVVDSFVTLTIEGGVELLLADRANIIVHGSLLANGSENNQVVFESNPHPSARRPYYNSQPNWGALVISSATGLTNLSHVHLKQSTYGHNRYLEKASISSFHSEVALNSVEIIDAIQPFYSEFGDIRISDCVFRSELTGDLINVKFAENALVENCDLEGNNAEDMDAIDYDGLQSGIIRNNKIYNFLGGNSDGIDLGEGAANVLIEGNEIKNITDKGISIGQASTAIVKQNVIVKCGQGIGIKDNGSYAEVDHNTFYNNTFGIAVFEKNAGRGGGSVDISNSIISQSTEQALFVDALSNGSTSYSLADTELLDGEENIEADPQFVNAAIFNFELRTSSPCIDTGDPEYENDPDGSRTDMGAYYTHQNGGNISIVMNEVNYNASNCEIADWVELYNYGNEPIDLSGWKLKDNQNEFVIPSFTLAAEAYIILCRDTDNFEQHYPEIAKLGNFEFGLSNGGESMTLEDNAGNIITSFTYDDTHPWPQGADGYCNTMELFDPNFSMAIPSFWHTSFSEMGSPGMANTEIETIEGLYINELMAVTDSIFTDEAGEFEDWFEIYNGSFQENDFGGLYVTDNFDNLLKYRLTRTNTNETRLNSIDFKTIFADNDVNQGVLHVPFKLASAGEQLALVQVTRLDTIILDSISFGPQTSTASFGQYGDGGGNWQLLEPTPNAINMQIVGVIEELLALKINLYPNPTNHYINISMEQIPDRVESIELIDFAGKLVLKDNHPESIIDLESIPSGVYYLIIHFEDVSVSKSLVIY